MSSPLTSAERVLTTVTGGVPDRVPYFLPVTMHGAAELGVPLDEYYRSPRLMAEGQLRLRAEYRHDFLYSFFYGAIELEAFGGEVEFFADGPPNAVGPLLTSPTEINRLTTPVVAESPSLNRALAAIELMAQANAGDALIVGVVMSPFSLPVMQLGFEEYLQVLHEQPALAHRLQQINLRFCIDWANAQLAAGANAIGYFDPVSSPTVTSLELALNQGIPLMKQAVAAINGPCAALFASGLSAPIIPEVAGVTAIVGVSSDEDLAEMKRIAAGRMTVMGNLNGIQMRRWTPDEARAHTREAIEAGAPGGGFILSDTHGEIPIQVPEDVLLAISDAVEEYGPYPSAGAPGA